MKDTCKILAQNCRDIISEYCMYMLTKLRVISFVEEQEITNTLQSKKNIQLYWRRMAGTPGLERTTSKFENHLKMTTCLNITIVVNVYRPAHVMHVD